tara:strand:+ start:510 stop:1229 length:720 start_codon:yes stop_codon:yes gene_type:complete
MIDYKEILQPDTIGLKEGENNIEACPGFSYEDSIKWIYQQPTVYSNLAKTLVQEFPDAKNVLELGCGPGCLSYYIRHYGGKETVTLDINKDAPQQSAFLDSNHFLCYTDKPYQIQDNNDNNVKFDLIISYEHFEHIPPKNLKIFFDNIKEHCHKNTIINATASKAETSGVKILDNNQDISNVSLNGFASHQSIFSKNQWGELLIRYGFKLLERKNLINPSNKPPNFELDRTIELTFKLK